MNRKEAEELLGSGWGSHLHHEMNKSYMKRLSSFIEKSQSYTKILPDESRRYAAYVNTDPETIKVVIVGDEPYNSYEIPLGFAFSSLAGRFPPGAFNMIQEIMKNFDYPEMTFDAFPDGNLMGWAKQGVFLPNRILTVEEGKPKSHCDRGWEIFTDRVMQIVSEQPQPMVILLWGNAARKYGRLFDNSDNKLVLESISPSDASIDHSGWFGNSHFKLCNQFLEDHGVDSIEWRLNVEIDEEEVKEELKSRLRIRSKRLK